VSAMTEAEYRALPGVSGTAIADLLRSPAIYAWKRANPTEATPSMLLGTLVHAFVLDQPRTFAANLHDYKTERAAWEARRKEIVSLGHTPVPGDVWREAAAIAEAVTEHPDAAALLALPGESEWVVTWDENGTPCKGRIDRLAESANGPLVIDLKTTRSLDGFDKSIGEYGIHCQTMHYWRGVAAERGIEPPLPLLIAVETSAPYRVQVVRLSAADAAQGNAACVAAYRVWRDCTDANSWPSGLPDGVTESNIPSWAARAWDARIDRVGGIGQ